ncbi:coiled-coil domain-containing protein 160 [Mesocricetus auratus]|uniref:Coiled-coil domain-containing protein 160 n=1 Tax=Mesocricetus auratus TaxID=10036 RepID=A0A1U7R1M0_MESAU|nr:coiled-coil domain-containing protein 160 [Mesocricetus auratus]XP_012980309.1 coiled-coil domain-containing protein 160 [Mesocricetus auratus]XP_040600561.1 coiled-coil domain-containing protein 160 [Mesocricetus auratus]
MDARRKHWKDNTFTPLLNEHNVLEDAEPLQSFSEETTEDRSRRIERISNFSSRNVQEGNKFKRKDYSSQIPEREQDPNLRERRMNTSKNVANANSVAWDLHSWDGATKESSPKRESASAWNKKELLAAAQGTRKKWTEAMTPKLRLHLLNEELGELNLKCRKIEKDFENAEKELLNSRKEASVKSVNFQEPGTAASKNDRELQALKNDLSEKATNVKSLTQELQQAKEVMYRLNLENRNLKDAFKKLKRQIELSTTLLREEMKLFHELEMEKIRFELGTIKNELRAEKTLRAKNTRGLELLGRHVASVVRSSHTADHFTGNAF